MCLTVPFTDSHQNFNPNPAPDRRLFDTRALISPFTPKDQFFTTQHYGHPGDRSGRVPVEGIGPRQRDARAVARRSPQDGQHRAHRRLRVLGQSSSAAGPDRQRPLDRRAAEDRARQGRPEDRTRGRSCSSAPIAAGGSGVPRHNFDVEQQYGRSIRATKALVDRRRSSPMRSTASR